MEEARQVEIEAADADEMVECLELQVAGWTAQWAEVLRADEDPDWRRKMQWIEKAMVIRTKVYETPNSSHPLIITTLMQ